MPEYRLTTYNIMIPLITKKDIYNKLENIVEKRESIGWIHMASIQMVMWSTFGEEQNTPIDLAIIDNRMKNKEEATLSILRGIHKYKKLIFNIYPKISYNIQDKDFDKILSFNFNIEYM